MDKKQVQNIDSNLQEFKKIDTHFHIGNYVSSSVNDSYEDLEIKAARALNFKKIIIIHTGLFFDLDYGTRETLEFLKSNKDFAYGLLVYNPHHAEKSLNMIRQHFALD